MGKLKLDFTGVESFVRADEGEHVAVLKAVEEKTSSAGNDMLVAVFEVTRGNSTGARIYNNFVLTEKALWNLKSFLEAVGIKADGKVMLDVDKLLGKYCIISVVHEEYNGSMKAKIDGFKKLEAKAPVIEEDDEDEIPEPVKKAKKPAPAPVVEEDDDEEEEVAPPKKAEKKVEPAKKVEKKKPAPVVEDDDDDWDED